MLFQKEVIKITKNASRMNTHEIVNLFSKVVRKSSQILMYLKMFKKRSKVVKDCRKQPLLDGFEPQKTVVLLAKLPTNTLRLVCGRKHRIKSSHVARNCARHELFSTIKLFKSRDRKN